MTDHGPQAPLGAERRALRHGGARAATASCASRSSSTSSASPPSPSAATSRRWSRRACSCGCTAARCPRTTARRRRRRRTGGRRRRRRFDRRARPVAQLLLAGSRPRRRGRGEAARHGHRAARRVVRAAGRAAGARAARARRQRARPHRRAQHRHARTRRTSCSGSPTAARRACSSSATPCSCPDGTPGRVGDHRPRARRRAGRAAPRLARPPQGRPDHLARLPHLPQDHARAGRRPAPSSDLTPTDHFESMLPAAHEPRLLGRRRRGARLRAQHRGDRARSCTPTPRRWRSSTSRSIAASRCPTTCR